MNAGRFARTTVFIACAMPQEVRDYYDRAQHMLQENPELCSKGRHGNHPHITLAHCGGRVEQPDNIAETIRQLVKNDARNIEFQLGDVTRFESGGTVYLPVEGDAIPSLRDRLIRALQEGHGLLIETDDVLHMSLIRGLGAWEGMQAVSLLARMEKPCGRFRVPTILIEATVNDRITYRHEISL